MLSGNEKIGKWIKNAEIKLNEIRKRKAKINRNQTLTNRTI